MGKPDVFNKGQKTKLIMNDSKTDTKVRKHKRSKNDIIKLKKISHDSTVSLKALSSVKVVPVVQEVLTARTLLGKRKKHLKHNDSIRRQSKDEHLEADNIGFVLPQKYKKAGLVSCHLNRDKTMKTQAEGHTGLVQVGNIITENKRHKKKKSYNKALTVDNVKNDSTVTKTANVQKLTHNNKRRRLLKNKLKKKKAAATITSDAADPKLEMESSSTNRDTPCSSAHATESQKVVMVKLPEILLPKSVDQFSANWKSLIANKHILPKHNKQMASQNKSNSANSFRQQRISKERRAKQQPTVKRSDDIWFDDVDEALLELPIKPEQQLSLPADSKAGQTENAGLTKCLAMDCEMVGIGHGGTESVLARVSLVNLYGHCVYDKFVKPRESVTDYRTFVSGIRPENLKAGAETFETVQKEVSDLIQGRILVGHALHNDLQVLYISHPHKSTRDTARYKPFRKLIGTRPSLKKLAEKVLGVTIQTGEHNSVEDAWTAMRLYTLHRKAWERLYIRKPKR